MTQWCSPADRTGPSHQSQAVLGVPCEEGVGAKEGKGRRRKDQGCELKSDEVYWSSLRVSYMNPPATNPAETSRHALTTGNTGCVCRFGWALFVPIGSAALSYLIVLIEVIS